LVCNNPVFFQSITKIIIHSSLFFSKISNEKLTVRLMGREIQYMSVRISTLFSFHSVIIAGVLNHRVLQCKYFCLLYTVSVFICGTEMHARQCGQNKSTILAIFLYIHIILCRIVYIPDCWGLRVITV